jgi:PfaB family protein
MTEINMNAAPPRLAVVGMDVLLGGIDGLKALQFALYQGRRQQPRLLSDDLIRLDAQDLPLFGLTDQQAASLDPEIILLLKTSGRAWRDANLPIEPGRAAFLFSTFQSLQPAASNETQPEIPFHFPGIVSNLSDKGNPLAATLLEAQQLFTGRAVDAVIISAACLPKEGQEIALKLNSGPMTLGLDRAVDGWTPGQGAAAVVLVLQDTALAAESQIYAVLDDFVWTPRSGPQLKKNPVPTFVSAETIQQSCRQVFSQLGITPQDIGYLEVLGSGFGPLDAAEIMGITQAYRLTNPVLSCVISSLGVHSGYLFNAAGLAGFVKTALCLHYRFFAATPGWSGPKKAELWQDTPFYVTPEVKTWFIPAATAQRKAALNCIGWDGSSLHLILTEADSSRSHSTPLLKQSAFYLFPLAGSSLDDLRSGLNKLDTQLQGTLPLQHLAAQQFKTYFPNSSAYALSIVGHDRSELQHEIELALKSLPGTFEHNKAWQTPMGSCFTPEPVGPQGKVAFVYPGGFNSYIGMGRDLFLLFPGLYDRATHLTADMGATIQDEALYPRSLEVLDKEQLGLLETRLSADPIAMITSGSLMAVLFTLIVREIFKITPAAALGYSLGEIAMLFGNGVWTQADATRAHLKQSPLFESRLSGPQNAVRFAWGLPQAAEKQPGENLWNNYFVMSPVDKVLEALQDEPRVYLTHINTPRQVVIGGDAEGCQRVISKIKCMSLKAPFDFALHCKAIRSEYDTLVEMYTWPVAALPALPLYSAAGQQPLVMDSQTIAHKMADMMCSPIDFPALVHQVYADGARIFIELGANANCSKWIEDTLKGSPCLAVSINRRSANDHESIVRLLARLVCHRVPLDLSPLY